MSLFRIGWQYVSQPGMDFDRAVTWFELDYRRHWEQFIAIGEDAVTPDHWRVPE